jgi:hypothetical protein
MKRAGFIKILQGNNGRNTDDVKPRLGNKMMLQPSEDVKVVPLSDDVDPGRRKKNL